MSKKVCLVDGSGYIFRAFYGLPPLTAPDGTPVNAVYGFTNMFLKLTQQIGCDYCLVLFDAKRQNFRNNIFPDYKGTRKEIPEDLIPQFPIIKEALEALSLNYLDMEGYEADDLIATYAQKAVENGLDVVVVSGDKDLMQLIRPHVEFFDPMKDKFITSEDVKDKFGVYPDKVIDVQALSGDTIDNVPGVAGIGPKTAALLVNEYGSLEGVLQHAPEIKQQKRRQTLIDNAENARISLQLVTLRTDVPVTHDLQEYECSLPHTDAMENFIAKYGFSSLKPKLQRWAQERCSELETRGVNSVFKNIETSYTFVDSEAKLSELAKTIKTAGLFSFETITSGENPYFDKLYGIALGVAEGKSYYVPLATDLKNDSLDLFASPQAEDGGLSTKVAQKYLQPLLTDNTILKIGCFLKRSWHFLAQIMPDVEVYPYEDIAVLSYDIDSSERKHNIEDLSLYYFDETLPKLDSLLGSGKNKLTFIELPQDKSTTYAAQRADFILRLYNVIKPRLVAEKKVAVYELYDRPLLKVLYDMERNGIMLNAPALKGLSDYFDERLNAIEQQIFAISQQEFNVGSPKQVGEILFDKLGLKGKKTPSGAWQTGADVLEELVENGVDLAQKILDWREISKLKSTYTDSLANLLDKTSRIHTTYLQTVANTGRLSSTNPNLQNIPIRSEEGKKIRSCFMAGKGKKLVSCDYSQVELRLLANVADVKRLKEAFANGVDVHTATASHVFGIEPEKVDSNLRRQAKAINFGIVYGISQYGLAKNIGVSSAEAKAYIDTYFAQMPEIKTYMEETIAFARKHGYVLTPFGRKCAVAGINDKNKRIVQMAERAAINAPIQGGAADIIKIAMIKMSQELQKYNLQTKMLLQIHDELIFEVPDSELDFVSKLIKEVMENVVDFPVKFEAELGVGANWTEAH